MEKRKLVNVVVAGEHYPLGTGAIHDKTKYRVKATGEFRPPKQGEWYLSGAVVEGYQAKGDLLTSYYIGKLVKGEIVSYWREITE